MPLNNYLNCIPIEIHEIELDENHYTVLFDQYNSFGFGKKNSAHYYQKESTVIELQQLIKSSLKQGYEHFLFDTSGSMAIEHAIYYSQLATKKQKVLKFHGCYHGSTHLIRRLDEFSPLSLPSTGSDYILGAPVLSYEKSLQEIEERLSTQHYGSILIDPNFCDYFLSPPEEYYSELRKLCDKYHVFLVFDEMRTGFRCLQKWAINEFKVYAHMIVGAKAICCGLPFSLVALHEDIYNKTLFQQVDEASTGFSYNPTILEQVITIIKDLNQRIDQTENNIFHTIAKFTETVLSHDFFSLKNAGGNLAIEFRSSKALFAASLCEGLLKKQNILVYRSENRIILCPHFTFSSQELSNLLNLVIESAKQACIKLQLRSAAHIT